MRLSSRRYVAVNLTFSVKYDSGTASFSALDGYYGVQSLLGITQLLLISLNAYVNRRIITRAPSAKGFHLVLGTSKTGSWEQIINLVITDPHVLSIFNGLGNNALYDLLKWGLCIGVGKSIPSICNKAKDVLMQLRTQPNTIFTTI